jgi:S-DNA-T family DNA segregation ATPase FtsK/SpoIIIE
MSEPSLIQQQRELLQALFQMISQMAQAKGAAAAQLKREQQAAEAALDQTRQQSANILQNGNHLLQIARDVAKEKQLYIPPDTTKLESARVRKSDHPDREMERCIAEAEKTLGKLRKAGLGCWHRFGIWVFGSIFLMAAFVLFMGILGGNGQFFNGLYIIAFVFSGLWLLGMWNVYHNLAARPYLAMAKDVAEAEQWQQQWLQQARDVCQAKQAHANTRYKSSIEDIEKTYQPKIKEFRSAFDDFTTGARTQSPDWTHEAWQNWSPAVSLPSIVRLGEFKVSVSNSTLSLTALGAFPSDRSILIKTTPASKASAVRGVQAWLLRLLATIPPGKLRFTFIDPLGLGQNVAPFMHLVDYDETLVTGKAWSEPQHIEQRLVDLAEHIENVIQKYLRNQFATIEDYNAQAGEIAEAYRILVAIDFPTNFNDATARRLVSIAQTGPRCGVYMLILADTQKPLPYGFSLADIERFADVIDGDEHFAWQDNDYKDCLLELDSPPAAVLFNRIVNTVGEVAKDNSRVEVPIERIVPSPEQYWAGTSRLGLRVGLGPASARKTQYLDLGQGTAQHALLVGKTGSGKSTLLHVLITNLALTYSPDEVELYLVDFKKGIEFKTYATHQLVHARVVAIESEREFGLSVLQGLDAELKRRGDLFRSVGVDGLADYRQRNSHPMPRILLLVDEFQEFFTEDDNLASQASQILDRLVRQGRAFGIHVLLGSQTLAGAYSLARSTIDQMAVRIALQCSEADSRLILADDNPAARLLSRPGESIYNAANGLIEGNTRFQVAWLPDEKREQYLKCVQTLSLERGYQLSRSQIVFEGNAPAEVDKNHLLHDLLTAPAWPEASRQVLAWLGDPIAIREPVAARFRRQSGSNFLIVGQNDEAALGTMASALISLAAQHVPALASGSDQNQLFYILDFSNVDASYAEVLTQVASRLPHSSIVGRRRQLPDIINELHSEVQRRLNSDGTSAPPKYLFVYGLQRARDLRQEEGFGFTQYGGSESAPPNSAQQFATILREGPDVGIHALVWCDNLNNLNRTLDRRTLREFEMKVVFQMSAEDSSNLIDTPVASKLGAHRALLYNEEEGRPDKFRPYGLPSEDWLIWMQEQFRKKLIS